MSKYLIVIVFLFLGLQCRAQTLQEMINIAQTKSLDASYVNHKYRIAELAYKYFKADRLPEIKLTSIPLLYNSDVVERYSYEEDKTVYRAQQYLYSTANLTIKQNVDFLGGYFYLESDLRRYKTLQNTTNQFTAVPFRLGYYQSLLGYNPIKWTKKIETLNFRLSQKEYLSENEQIAIETINRFFYVVTLSEQLKLARMKYETCDSLYQTGIYKKALGRISSNDLYELRIEMIKSETEIWEIQAKIEAEKRSFAEYLQLDDTTSLNFIVPVDVPEFDISMNKAQELALANSTTLLKYDKSIIQNKQAEARVKTQRFLEASVSVNVGWHQVSETFNSVYDNLLNEQSVSINVTIPLADFGRRKTQLSQIRESLELDRISEQKAKTDIIDDIQTKVSYVPIYRRKIESTKETYHLSEMMFNEALESFKLGRITFSKVRDAIVHQKAALVDYYVAIRDYWLNYYEIRSLTLYDFERECDIRN